MSINQAKNIFRYISQSDVLKIVVVTSLLFVLLHFVRVSLLISGDDVNPFMTYVWNNMSLPPTWQILILKPWTLLTYMFTDMSFMRILGNMIWLWIFASKIEDLKGKYQILPIYLLGGIVGALFMVTANSLSSTPNLFYHAGGEASLISVVVATILYKPNYKFWLFGSIAIPIWLLGLVFLGLTFVSINNFNLPILFLYLGGTLVGVFYNYGLPNFFTWCTVKFVQIDAFVTNNDNFILKKENTNRKPIGNKGYQTLQVTSQKIDMILDKINEKGINSLTEDERNILEKYSKN